MRNRRDWLVTLAFGVALGVVASHLTQAHEHHACLERAQVIAVKLDHLANQLTSLHAEIHARSPRQSVSASEAEPAVHGAVATSDAAMSTALARLDVAVGRGRWTADDVIALRALAPRMVAEQLQEFVRRYSQHINAGELRAEVPGPAF